jgi:ferric-dicitrate binding protein FerR (iron transport regulator)
VDDFEVVALGTAFGVEEDQESLLRVKVVESKVEINRGQKEQVSLVEEGNKAEFSGQSNEIKTAQLTEQDMEEEFIAWNVINDEKYFAESRKQKEEEVVEEKVAKKEEVKKEEVKKKEAEKAPTKKETAKESSDGYATAIALKGDEDGDKVRFSWTISGGNAPKGFKIVKSKDPNPVYPGDDYLYISDKDDRSAVWKGFKKDKTYYFRICVYKGGECGAYSDNVKIDFD